MSIQIITADYLISEYSVMQSNAGYYIGHACFDPAIPEAGLNLPYTRESEYMHEADAHRSLFSFIRQDCKDSLEEDAVAAYRMALIEGLGVERAVCDAFTAYHRRREDNEYNETVDRR